MSDELCECPVCGAGLEAERHNVTEYRVNVTISSDGTDIEDTGEPSISDRYDPDPVWVVKCENGHTQAEMADALEADRVIRPYGFEDYGTGGGCMAWYAEHPNGNHTLITEPEGCSIPIRLPVVIGTYCADHSEPIGACVECSDHETLQAEISRREKANQS
jgi:hypothetical protein